jgi:hypothetical protein
LLSLSLGTAWCRSVPAFVGALSCKACAFAIISAKDPFGGGLEGVTAAAGLVGALGAGAAFVAVDVPIFDTGFAGAGLEVTVEAGLDRALGAADEIGGLVAAGFTIAGLLATFDSGFTGRASWSSALRFRPPLTLPLGGGGCRTAVGFRSSFLGAADGAGAAGAWDGGRGEGLPVWRDERTESRNY